MTWEDEQVTALVDCFHGGNPDRPQACPPMCPVQAWPRYMFRISIRGDWVLKRKYRRQES